MGERNKNKLSVLFFSQRFPLPMDTGGKIRTGKMLQYLREVFDITLICNVDSPKDDQFLDQVQNLCSEFHSVPWKELGKYSLGFYLRVLARMWSRYPVAVQNDYTKELESKIESLVGAKSYDLLICDFLQPTLNFRNVMKGQRTLLFQHNVESLIVKRHYETASNVLMKLFWYGQWKKMVKYEKMMCRCFDGVVTVSENDKALLENEFGAENVFAIPTGVDTSYFSPNGLRPDPNSLIYVGSMDWLPNEDAMMFFAEQILPIIKQKVPEVKLTIVGRNPSDALAHIGKRYPEVTIVGRVDDVRPYVRQHCVFIVPLRIGGGTRIKVFEAMAMGKAIVSTTIGTEGLPLDTGEYVLQADTPSSFAEAVIRLLLNEADRKKLEVAARSFVEKNCSWEKASEAFTHICSTVSGKI